jgi:hypothetical protein
MKDWSEWKLKYAWFPILHDDWSVTWLKYYKVRYRCWPHPQGYGCEFEYLIEN